MKQSFSWWCFNNRGVDNHTLLAQAHSIGFQGVELINKDLFDQARDAGLIIVSHGGHASIASGLNDSANHDRIVSEIEANLELAVKYQIPNLIVFSGNRREGQSDAEGADHAATCLGRVAKSAESAGVCLTIELLNSKVDHAGYQADHSQWIWNVVDQVRSPSVKCLYDIYHAQIMEGDVIRSIKNHHDAIGHYHTAGNPGRHEIDGSQELHYPAIFRAIGETDYCGWIGHEFVPLNNPLISLKSAFELTVESFQ